jgi:hypothetical protein
LEKFTEQPYLLDPFLERFIQPLAASVGSFLLEWKKGKVGLRERYLDCFEVLAAFIRIRGAKTVSLFMPTSVEFVVPTFATFNRICCLIKEKTLLFPCTFLWMARTVLLVWLLPISQVPFPLAHLFLDDQQVRRCFIQCHATILSDSRQF